MGQDTLKKIKVIELFAGVGGFRIGIEGYKGLSSSSFYKKRLPSVKNIEFLWSNQWEPSTKRQYASDVYKHHWGDNNHSNEDISIVPTELIPNHDLLVGGFPCQDYSVAASLSRSGGIQGKKGVLWWQIHRILLEKGKNKPKYLFLENVDRLLKSPANQRGRDFAIMLASLSDLGYNVEWRVINAADYGMPQRRRRVFIIAYLENTEIGKASKKNGPENWIAETGILAKAFQIEIKNSNPKSFKIVGDLTSLSSEFEDNKNNPFENSGFMSKRNVFSIKTYTKFSGIFTKLENILDRSQIEDKFFIKESDLNKWEFLKGPKKQRRKTKYGFEYNFSEGGMIFPDSISNACRTIITGEGGPSPSRFKHVIIDPIKNKLRRLTPLELERANMFPDNHTNVIEDITDEKRAFFMGNALVVGVIEKISIEFVSRILKK